MRIIDDVKLDYKDVLITPKRSSLSSRSEVNISRTFKFRSGNSWTGVPIIAANMDGVGTINMSTELDKVSCMTALTKHIDTAELAEHLKYNPNSICSIGITNKDLEKFDAVYSQLKINNINVCIDVANGYTQTFVEFILNFRKKYPSVVLMAGNVVTPEMTEELILSGVDIVKVGIGPGSVCTTRKITGIGYPQLSAVIECADAAHGLGGHIIADGGCVVPGDVVKAFAAGADFVMLGGMLAGHDEGGGEVVTVNGKSYCRFYGMSSDTAMNKHNGGVANYRASEGKTVEIPYKGPVKNTIQQIFGGLRSACTYVGASNLKELPKRTTFIRVNNQINTSFNSYEV